MSHKTTPLQAFFLALLFMALSSFLPTSASSPQKPSKRRRKQQQKAPNSWEQFMNLLTCKQVEVSQVQDPSRSSFGRSSKKLSSSCSSICNFRDVVHGSIRVIHRDENSPENSSFSQETGSLLRRNAAHVASQTSRMPALRPNAAGGSHFRRLSGCYECHAVVDSGRYTGSRAGICSCSECGEVFGRAESLEAHQATRHAVSELGPEDSGRNIVEIIFKSSWQREGPTCTNDRILKVHNPQRTVSRFESYRAAVKACAAAAHDDRCAADGNELLRFHCTTLACSLGAHGASALCAALPSICGVCSTIRRGFSGGEGTRTAAGSGRAHDSLGGSGARAMLVCRVIAGQVRRRVEVGLPPANGELLPAGGYDSVVGHPGMCSNVEELEVFNPRAILPCFVVIYRT